MTTTKSAVVMPRVNANDESGLLVRWMKVAGEPISRGELLAFIETAKAAVDLEAHADGFFHPLVPAGTMVPVGEPIAWIVDRYDPTAIAVTMRARSPESPAAGAERMISRKAAALMAAQQLTAADFAGDAPIREADVRRFLEARAGRSATSADVKDLALTDRSVLLFGAADQGAVVLDCLRAASEFAPVCFVDENRSAQVFESLPVFETTVLAELRNRGICRAHVCIGAPEPKLRIAKQLRGQGFAIISAIHPRATISATATLGEGVYVGPGVIIGPGAKIGDYCQVNNNATIPHHVTLGTGARISDGVHLAGGLHVGDRSYLGLGVTVNTDCHIGSDVTVVSGVSVFDKVPNRTVVRAATLRRSGSPT
jgi:sugar O-acyltransferase (sialic acid O-acetyltransferase NeuD family)